MTASAVTSNWLVMRAFPGSNGTLRDSPGFFAGQFLEPELGERKGQADRKAEAHHLVHDRVVRSLQNELNKRSECDLLTM